MVSYERISQLSREKPDIKFSQLFRIITIEELRNCHNAMKPHKAVGIDGIQKSDYEKNLKENLENLHRRLWDGSYRPRPARKVEIPKDDGKMRTLCIYCYEDKIVQEVIKRILEAVFEPMFYNEQMGFRPNRGCHTALALLNNHIEKNYTNYVLDADVKGFFDNLEHKWILKFVGARISDPKFLALVHKMLRAGIMTGTFVEGPNGLGSGQGSICSPILANIYMHYVLIWWCKEKMFPKMKGFCGLVVYADDFVACFQHKNEAMEFHSRLRIRFANFGLKLAENKTRLIEFGKFAEGNSRKRTGKSAETFTFLGFTHYCSKSRAGEFRVKRRTARKKFVKKIKEVTKYIKERRNKVVKGTIFRLNQILVGYYNYYGITDNYVMINKFYSRICKELFKWLNRRSQKKSMTWEQFNHLLTLKEYELRKPRIKVNIYKIVFDIPNNAGISCARS